MVGKVKKTRVSLTLTHAYVEILDQLVDNGIFIDRQDACREGLRDLFKKHGLTLNLGLVPDIP